jgi:hypothetical protein
VANEPAVLLAQRLRSLRLTQWPHRTITQRHLAEAFGGLSVPTISSWESPTNPKLPPPERLAAYAMFFATERSMEGNRARLLAPADLTPEESRHRDELLNELTILRSAADQDPVFDPGIPVPSPRPRGLLSFPAGERVTIVCGLISEDSRLNAFYTDPKSPDYEELYTFGDPRALMELYGYIRELNPLNDVDYKTSDRLTADDYATHLVLIGGVDWNTATSDLFDQADIPLRQHRRPEERDLGVFEVVNGDQAFESKLAEDGRLLEDIAHFYRGPNPNNAKRTVTLFNGNYSRGTLGAVRSLTDPKFRDRNGDFVRERLAEHGQLSLLTRAVVLNNQVVTPDWTRQRNRLHEWWGSELGSARPAPTVRT